MMSNRNQPTMNGAASTPIDWGRCLTEHQGWLQSVILARTGEPQAVDEVWQQVSLAAVRQASPLHDAACAPAWLYRLAVVQSIRYRRQQARQRRLAHRASTSNGHAPVAEDPFQWLLREERQQLVREALGQLTGRDAEILMLKYEALAARLQEIGDKSANLELLRRGKPATLTVTPEKRPQEQVLIFSAIDRGEDAVRLQHHLGEWLTTRLAPSRDLVVELQVDQQKLDLAKQISDLLEQARRMQKALEALDTAIKAQNAAPPAGK
jgi:DNA-directed RNA polymerase specialized sigma24 family protein